MTTSFVGIDELSIEFKRKTLASNLCVFVDDAFVGEAKKCAGELGVDAEDDGVESFLNCKR